MAIVAKKDKEKEERHTDEEDLAKKGILFLSGEVSEKAVRSLQEQILQANLKPSSSFLQMLIHSPGGGVLDGFGLIDMMSWSKLPIYTTGIGRVSSMALLVLMAGEKGKRVATTNSLLLSHRFWGLSGGNYSDMIARRKMEDLLHSRVVRHYIKYTNMHDEAEVEKVLLKDTDVWLTPEEALEYGIVDEVHEG